MSLLSDTQPVENFHPSEAQFRSFFENAVEGIFQTTPEGRYLLANPMLARIYGYDSPDELIVGLTDIQGQLYCDSTRRTAFRNLLQEQDAVWGFEAEILRKDGRPIWISENARAIRSVDGILLGYEGTVVDITARKRAEEELALARLRESEIGARIQKTLLLGQPPTDIPRISVSAFTVPSQWIDGDFYDFLRHGDDCLDVIVGDVMGKGVPAALVGAAIKSRLLHALSHLLYVSGGDRSLPEPEMIVNRVHSEVTARFIGLQYFATLCYMRFDLERREVRFVDCGHMKTLCVHAEDGGIEELEGDNLPLGCCKLEEYRQWSAPIRSGDLFCFYSDGLTEAQNSDGEPFETERLRRLLVDNRHADLERLLVTIREAVEEFAHAPKFKDDLTCVLLRIGALDEA